MIRDREYDSETLISFLDIPEFNRKPLVFNFLKILNSIEYNTYIALNGRWGSGKTIFVKQIELLNKPDNKFISNPDVKKFVGKYEVFYYNAWENDYHVDPLQSLLLKLISNREFNDAAKDKIKKALKIIFTNIVKKISENIVDLEQLSASKFDDMLSEIITIEKRKETITQLIDEIRNGKKFLIILDELDRCSPVFAVRLLETIKHYFDNDNIVFLISTNNHILAQTVKKFYGTEFDGEGYLDKFYDLRIDLPEINIFSYMISKGQKRYCEMAKYLEMSLREANRFCSLLSIYNVKDCDLYGVDSDMIILPFALALKVKKPYDFDRFIKGDDHLLREYLKINLEEEETEIILRKYKLIMRNGESNFVFIHTAYLINVKDPIDGEK